MFTDAEKRRCLHQRCGPGPLPGHVTGVAHPAVLRVVVAAAGLADVELAVETLAPGVEQELEGL